MFIPDFKSKAFRLNEVPGKREIEIVSRKSVLGKQIAVVKIVYTGEVMSVPFSELSDEKKVPTDAEITFKAIAAKIKREEMYQLKRDRAERILTEMR